MKKERLLELNTEQENPNTITIDSCNIEDILYKINNEDQTVAGIIREQIPSISRLVEAAYQTVIKGGRIFYFGAGTSGRLGILDASECPPTYGVSPDMFQGIIAGGTSAIFISQEGIEDKKEAAVSDLQMKNFSSEDLLIGLAASGRTPYVVGGLEYARKIGAKTGSVCCVENGEISSITDYPIEAVTGPEVIAGSTRMKAGTAQKMILNMISTAVMIKQGKVFKNLMVDVQPSNKKLETRACHVIQLITELSDEETYDLYLASHKQVKTAIVMYFNQTDYDTAVLMLEKVNGHIRKAID